MHAIVHPADIQDRDGGVMVMATLFGLYPFLSKLYANGGYQGPNFRDAVQTATAKPNVEIVERSDQAKGFVVLPGRWVVERTFACLNRGSRLAKDWECLNRKARAFVLLQSIRLMVRRFGRATAGSRTDPESEHLFLGLFLDEDPTDRYEWFSSINDAINEHLRTFGITSASIAIRYVAPRAALWP